MEEDATARVIVLGDGSANIALNAGGDIRVSNQADAGESAEDFGNFAGMGFDWSGFGERISRRWNRQPRVQVKAEASCVKSVKMLQRRTNRARGKVNVGVGRWNWDLSPKGVQ